MKRLWKRSLTGQFVVLILLALTLSQVVFFLIYRSERGSMIRTVRLEDFLARSASVARLLRTTDPSLHQDVLRSANTATSRYWLSGGVSSQPLDWQQTARANLLRALSDGLPAVVEEEETPARKEYLANPRLEPSDLQDDPNAAWVPLEDWTGENPAQFLDLARWNGFGLVVQVRDDLWLNMVMAKPKVGTQTPLHYYLSLGFAALVLSFAAVLVARRISLPLRRLSDSAERIGRGEEAEPLPEEGAGDIRRTAIAFNQMQARLRRFVEDRTRMVAAISHDLRTPITTLRLRAEFIEDPETKAKIIATLDEMQAMAEATLAFAKEEAIKEETRSVDIASLLESLCEDLAELEWKVDVSASERLPWRCRPDALRRALRNLIENAVRYGNQARLSLRISPAALEILIDDDGPGIPEGDREKAFLPFVRLEQSRNRATGGVGLGLPIARSIVRSHGGDVLLENLAGGGLRVVVQLPRAA